MKSSVLIICIALTACAAPAKVLTLPHDGMGAFVFDVPSSRSGTYSAVSVAIIRPESTQRPGVLSTHVPIRTDAEADVKVRALLDEFADAAQRDFGLVVMSKGLKTAGTFRSLQDMTFSEKREATFSLVSKLTWEIEKAVGGTPTFMSPVEGVAVVAVGCDIQLVEALSGEKLWTKHFDLGPQRVPFTVGESQNWQMQAGLVDPRPEAVGKALKAVYRDLMDRFGKSFVGEKWNDLESDAVSLKRRASPIMR